jgi:hypothetical protein
MASRAIRQLLFATVISSGMGQVVVEFRGCVVEYRNRVLFQAAR